MCRVSVKLYIPRNDQISSCHCEGVFFFFKLLLYVCEGSYIMSSTCSFKMTSSGTGKFSPFKGSVSSDAYFLEGLFKLNQYFLYTSRWFLNFPAALWKRKIIVKFLLASCSAQTVTRIGLLEEIPRSGVQIPCLS